MKEVVDKHSGAILFKKDQESLDIEYLLKEVADLKKRIQKLEKAQKENS